MASVGPRSGRTSCCTRPTRSLPKTARSPSYRSPSGLPHHTRAHRGTRISRGLQRLQASSISGQGQQRRQCSAIHSSLFLCRPTPVWRVRTCSLPRWAARRPRPPPPAAPWPPSSSAPTTPIAKQTQGTHQVPRPSLSFPPVIPTHFLLVLVSFPLKDTILCFPWGRPHLLLVLVPALLKRRRQGPGQRLERVEEEHLLQRQAVARARLDHLL